MSLLVQQNEKASYEEGASPRMSVDIHMWIVFRATNITIFMHIFKKIPVNFTKYNSIIAS